MVTRLGDSNGLLAAVRDYQDYFNRVELRLETTDNSYLPTDKRIAEYVKAAASQASRNHRLADGSMNPDKYKTKKS